MRGRKKLSPEERLKHFGVGIVGMMIAVLLGSYGNFEFSGVAAFIIGAFAAGGIFRGVFGFDEV